MSILTTFLFFLFLLVVVLELVLGLVGAEGYEEGDSSILVIGASPPAPAAKEDGSVQPPQNEGASETDAATRGAEGDGR